MNWVWLVIGWDRFNSKRDRIARLISQLNNTRLKRSDPAYAALGGVLNSDLGRFNHPGSTGPETRRFD